MAYLWSDKIVDYYWSNPELDTVAVLWQDPEDKLNREHYIKVDEEDSQWMDFVKEVPYEKINERTEVRHEEFREEFRNAFRQWAEQNQTTITETVHVQPTPVEDIFMDFIHDYESENADHKEFLFKLKLKIFEQEIVRNSKDSQKYKDAKTFIRKSDNPLNVLLGYMVFSDNAKLDLADKKKFDVKGVYVPVK